MPKTATKEHKCAKCGVDVRDDTQFCYNCGEPTAAAEPNGKGDELDPKAKAALDDLAEKLKGDDPAKNDQLAKAADERRRSRVEKRKPRSYRWEAIPDSSMTLVIIAAAVIATLAGVVVLITTFFR